MGWAELKEFQEGHEHLHASLAAQNRSVDEMGKRHVNRFLSDAYLKGQVRGQVECTNLRAHHRDDAVVSAERIATSAFESFAGGSFADLVLRMTSSDPTEHCAPTKSAVRWTRRQASGTFVGYSYIAPAGFEAETDCNRSAQDLLRFLRDGPRWFDHV